MSLFKPGDRLLVRNPPIRTIAQWDVSTSMLEIARNKLPIIVENEYTTAGIRDTNGWVWHIRDLKLVELQGLAKFIKLQEGMSNV